MIQALQFNVPPKDTLCVYEYIPSEATCVMSYYVVSGDDLNLQATVSTPSHRTVLTTDYTSEGFYRFGSGVSSSTGYLHEENGKFSFCFTNESKITKSMQFFLRVDGQVPGIEDVDESELTKEQKMEKDTKDVAEILHTTAETQRLIRAQEQRLHSLATATGSSVSKWSFIVIISLAAISAVQLYQVHKLLSKKKKTVV
ncbi:Transmembrane emp24 domain-containing protein like protein [Aduncisulcus paluster]|uniref:Transmembrane emp24 domain-containing protein like protein n=1 Tax=Aduncisulcus paluster TaxID=2918883 RepID=A0ABQ5JZZ9_9EUKA|nr:Transmembrane emp24 domain-containing protein like protein [Aduncisulcus paluster]